MASAVGAPLGSDAVQFATVQGGSAGGQQVFVSVSGSSALQMFAAPFASPKARFATCQTELRTPATFPFVAPNEKGKQFRRAMAARDAFTVSLGASAASNLEPMIASITSNFHLPLFKPSKDPAISEWKERADLLPALMRLHKVIPDNQLQLKSDYEIVVDAATADKLESTTLAWSDVWISDNNLQSRSCFLALGSKDGTITLWKFDASLAETPTYTAQISLKPHSTWVSKLGWSSWMTVEDTSVKYCYLLTSYADGTVHTHILSFQNNQLLHHPTQSTLLLPQDNKSASVMKFCPHTLDTNRCAITKGNTLYLWTAPILASLYPNVVATTPNTSPKGILRNLQLPIFMPVGGVTWSLMGDEIRIYSVDGKCFTVAVIPEGGVGGGGNAAAAGGGGDTPPSAYFGDESAASNSIADVHHGPSGGVLVLLEDTTHQFYKEVMNEEAAGGDFGDDDAPGEGDGTGDNVVPVASSLQGKVIRYYGAVSSPNGLVDIILYTVSVSGGLDYKTDKTTNCHLLVHWNYDGRLNRNRDLEDAVVNRVMSLLKREDLPHLLWDVLGLLHHVKEGDLPVVQEGGIVSRLIYSTREFFATFNEPEVARAVIGGKGYQAIGFLKSIPDALFCNRRMNSLRIQSHILLHLMNWVPTVNKQQTAVTLVENYRTLLHQYMQISLQAIYQYLSDERTYLSEHELLMLTLFGDHCLQYPSEDTLNSLASIFLLVKQRGAIENISSICDEYLGKIQPVLMGAGAEFFGGESKEQCLACQGGIVFLSPWKAVCSNGHPWDRCAASFLTAATPKTRFCLGCNRKTIAPEAIDKEPEQLGPKVDDGHSPIESAIMKGILECMSGCFYCGNRLKL